MLLFILKWLTYNNREERQSRWTAMQTIGLYFRESDREKKCSRAQGSISWYLTIECHMTSPDITYLFIRINAQLITRRLCWEYGGHNYSEGMVSCAGVKARSEWGTAMWHNSENGKFGTWKLQRTRSWNKTPGHLRISWDKICISLNMSKHSWEQPLYRTDPSLSLCITEYLCGCQYKPPRKNLWIVE